MSSMYNIIQELSSTSSTNKKQQILKDLSYEDQLGFCSVAQAALDNRVNYWISSIDEEHQPTGVDADLFESIVQLLDVISERKLTGHAARDWLYDLYNDLSADDAKVLELIIKRDLRCGVSARTINKVFPYTIYEHPYMRCSSFSEKSLSNIGFPCYSQLKMDGLYIDIVIKDGVKYMTRNGQTKPEYNNPALDQVLIDQVNGSVLMGEALAVDESGNLMNRQDSNGYLNGVDVDPTRLRFFLWDVVPYNQFLLGKFDKSCSSRLDMVSTVVDQIDSVYDDSVLSLVDTVVCNDKDDILDHFRKCREVGEEGTVIKDFNGIWKDGTSKHQIKCKVIFDCDLKVVGYKLGQGKYENKLGALLCETSDGKLQVSVGGGYKEKEREDFLNKVQDWIESGQIVTVRGNDVVKNRDDESLYAIFLPRFVEARKDKTEADTLEQVQEQVKSFTDALDMIK